MIVFEKFVEIFKGPRIYYTYLFTLYNVCFRESLAHQERTADPDLRVSGDREDLRALQDSQAHLDSPELPDEQDQEDHAVNREKEERTANQGHKEDQVRIIPVFCFVLRNELM